MHPCQLDLNLTDRAHLEAIVRRSSSSQQLAFRALLVLMVADGSSISGTAKALTCCRPTRPQVGASDERGGNREPPGCPTIRPAATDQPQRAALRGRPGT